jgi:hypothetical protein
VIGIRDSFFEDFFMMPTAYDVFVTTANAIRAGTL